MLQENLSPKKEIWFYIYPTCCITEVSMLGWFLNDEDSGYQTKTFASSTHVKSLEKWNLKADFTLEEIDISEIPKNVVGLIFPGGYDIIVSPKLTKIIHFFNDNALLIGAICAGPTHLAEAGILKGHRYTTSRLDAYYSDQNLPDPFPRESYVDTRCVSDGNLITANGIALIDFADRIFEYLGFYNKNYTQEDFRSRFTPKWES